MIFEGRLGCIILDCVPQNTLENNTFSINMKRTKYDIQLWGIGEELSWKKLVVIEVVYLELRTCVVILTWLKLKTKQVF